MMEKSNDDLIDVNQINNLKQLFNEGFKDFIERYFNDFEKKDAELKAAFLDKKMDSVRKIAHALKGSSLSVGATQLATLCAQIETASKAGNEEEALREYHEMQLIYPKIKEAFSRHTT
jgi:HPt (histidine-containing phosphotransfer) domain-containing protein